ncbi:hypothetical protein BGZ65_004997 [Modicella reniformis]|uniref:Palmitoyltransferase n=1 Tax=Modicella reniformis TaxID=1440133 RepID=A0A9P6M8P8_9FUNG|nr:hypothetical protein BGZ65_004997 [Modicella reniformis]
MSTSIAFEPLPGSDPADTETITTRPRRIPTFEDRIELLVDKANAKLGPFLVFTAIILLFLNIYCYFAVFIPFHYPQQKDEEEDKERTNSNVGYIANMIWSCYLVWGIIANYFYAVKTPPGSVLDEVLPENEGNLYQSVLLQMDGHFNHRYFVMFLTYLPTACVYYVYMGIGPFLLLTEYEDNDNWPYPLPQALVAFSIVLAGAFSLAVGGMGCWHWYLTLTAQTTLEQHHNSVIKDACKKKGDKFSNMYDFGVLGNLQDFFNIGRRGPWYTALVPIRIPPIGNGKRYQKSGRGYAIHFGDDDDIV